MNPVRSLARAQGAIPEELGGATLYGMKRLLLIIPAVFIGALILNVPVARAEYCFNGPNRPQIGLTGDVFWGNPPSPYPDVTLSGGMVARMSLEGTFPGDDPFIGSDCEGVTATVQIFSDGDPSNVAANVSGSLLPGSQIQPGNLGSWQWFVDWPHNLFDGRYRYKVIAINAFAVNGVTSSNVLTIVGVGPPPPPLTCGLVANPSSGTPPLSGVDMTVSITSPWDGTAHEYGIDCTNDGTYEGTQFLTTNPFTFVDACNYPTAGTYRPRGHLRNLATQQQADCTLGIVTLFPPASADIICNGGDACSIAFGASANLNWTSSNTTSCTVAPGGGNGTSGSQSTGSLTTTTTYTLSCSGSGGSASDTVIVTVGAPPAPSADIKCNGLDSCSIAFGASANLNWTSSNTTSCTVAPGGGNGTSGSQSTGSLTANATYTLNCSGAGGSTSDTVVVTVGAPPPVTADLQCNGANACSIAFNTSANLSWTSSNATSCTLFSVTLNIPTGFNGITNSVPTGNLNSSTTYRLDCTGSAGSTSDTVVVSVGAPPPPPVPTASITCNGIVNACSIAFGGTANINWTCTNSMSGAVSNTGDSVTQSGTSGSTTTPPLSSGATYSLACSGAGGSANATVNINVSAAPTPTPTVEAVAAGPFQLVIPNPFSGDIDSLQDIFDAIITFLYYIAGPIVVIMIILAGLFFLFARDQADKINTAKKILTYALIGFAIILIGRGFIALINSILLLGS